MRLASEIIENVASEWFISKNMQILSTKLKEGPHGISWKRGARSDNLVRLPWYPPLLSTTCSRPISSLGHQGERTVSSEAPKFLNNVQ